MQSRSDEIKNLKRAQKILNLVDNAIIYRSPRFGSVLNKAREETYKIAYETNKIAPAMTACIATTYLNQGLCQELSNRYIIEYIDKFKDKNISLVALSGTEIKKEDHMLVFIGPITVPENLVIGKGNNDPIIGIQTTYSLNQLLKENTQGVIADPLLNCVGRTTEEIKPLLQYCEKYGCKYVRAVRSFD